MKIYLKAYTRNNLGDDLFIKMFLQRYCNNQIYMISSYKKNFLNNQVKVYKELFCWKLLKKISQNRFSLENYLINKAHLSVLLGGSMFIEPKKINYYLLNKKLYIMGTNFGPYHSFRFLDNYRLFFKNAEDICFRDKFSYQLFQNLGNVRMASDIVFSLDLKNVHITDHKKVVISVIDCSKKFDLIKKQHYENEILKLIKMFYQLNYEIILMSFCKAEGDEEEIITLLDKIDDSNVKNRVHHYFYNGDIDEALDVIGDSQIIVGSRFHANILGLIMNKVIIPIAYSDKTINVLKDMNFKGKIFDIRDEKNFDVLSLNDKDLSYKMDVSFLRKDAENHFQELDKILTRR